MVMWKERHGCIVSGIGRTSCSRCYVYAALDAMSSLYIAALFHNLKLYSPQDSRQGMESSNKQCALCLLGLYENAARHGCNLSPVSFIGLCESKVKRALTLVPSSFTFIWRNIMAQITEKTFDKAVETFVKTAHKSRDLLHNAANGEGLLPYALAQLHNNNTNPAKAVVDKLAELGINVTAVIDWFQTFSLYTWGEDKETKELKFKRRKGKHESFVAADQYALAMSNPFWTLKSAKTPKKIETEDALAMIARIIKKAQRDAKQFAEGKREAGVDNLDKVQVLLAALPELAVLVEGDK